MYSLFKEVYQCKVKLRTYKDCIECKCNRTDGHAPRPLLCFAGMVISMQTLGLQPTPGSSQEVGARPGCSVRTLDPFKEGKTTVCRETAARLTRGHGAPSHTSIQGGLHSQASSAAVVGPKLHRGGTRKEPWKQPLAKTNTGKFSFKKKIAAKP